MTVTAKPVLKNKFWIVEHEGVRVGTLSKNDEGFIMSSKSSVEIFRSESALKKKFGKDFLVAKIKDTNVKSNTKEVHGYPTRTNPYNSMFDIQRKLPLFTKSVKSKSVYCAGYYLVKFNINWLKSFCPKLITIERNDYMGPYKTELEMKAALSNVNRTT
tara:strand:- start:39930 stop:40406 length:477 start_codon:yes stop_codon:yes gene_type:complete